jgi:ABC-type cobalamin transport system permease subunit
VKGSSLQRLAPLILSYLFVATGSANLACGQSVPFVVQFWYPTNNEVFVAPAKIGVHAQVVDSNLVETVEYFSGDMSLGIVTNTGGIWLTNTRSDNPFYLLWTNVPAGDYTLTAVATDSAGMMATSPPVNIRVVKPTPPDIPFTVRLLYPSNGQSFLAPANVGIYASVLDSNLVKTVQFFAGDTSLGIVTNTTGVWLTNTTSRNPFHFLWTNVPAGDYTLTAVATDTAGIMATSPPVKISVVKPMPPNIPFTVRFLYPTNGQTFLAPANIGMRALVLDSNLVETVQFFSGDTSLGIVTNTGGVWLTNDTTRNPFYFMWTNVPAGDYTLTAVATDSAGIMATSPPVKISVVKPMPPNIPFTVRLLYPTNGQIFLASANIGMRALVLDSNLVETVQFFSGDTSLGIVTNTAGVWLTNNTTRNPFYFVWTNVPAGDYTLTAVATDSAGIMATSPPVKISVVKPMPPNIPFTVRLLYPTNGQTFLAPANIGMRALVLDSNLVETVQFFSGDTSLGIVTNTAGVWLTNNTTRDPFYFVWTHVPAGDYTLTAVATDSAGIMSTSPPVKISVVKPMPPNIPFTVRLLYPTNGQTFLAPANIGMRALVLDSNLVETVQFFSGDTSLGIVTNTAGVWLTNDTTRNPFYFVWTNVPAGDYTLTAVATDSAGIMATSPPVKISVVKSMPPNIPFTVRFLYPTNGQIFLAPANVGMRALVLDSNLVETVQFFSDDTSLGVVTNTAGVWLTNNTSRNPFYFVWTNVPAGDYTLTAVATDSAGIMATSPPISIYIVTNLPSVVRIYAPDPVAIEGTNFGQWFLPGTRFGVTNTATFLVYRDGATNTDLTVSYNISGTATNGVDYATIPDTITIPATKRYALITILPLSDADSAFRHYDTVILALTKSDATPPTYRLGSPNKAAAVILEENVLPILYPMVQSLADGTTHVSLPATNGMNFCLEISSDLITWVPVCTNTVLKGSAQYVDPDSSDGDNRFYRIVPAALPSVSPLSKAPAQVTPTLAPNAN